MKVFCYTKDAEIQPAVIKKLERAGYVVVEVTDLDYVRIIEPMPDGMASAILHAAVSAIGDSLAAGPNVRGAFAENLAKEVEKLRIPSPPPTKKRGGR